MIAPNNGSWTHKQRPPGKSHNFAVNDLLSLFILIKKEQVTHYMRGRFSAGSTNFWSYVETDSFNTVVVGPHI
jgi:hypothetical protein